MLGTLVGGSQVSVLILGSDLETMAWRASVCLSTREVPVEAQPLVFQILRREPSLLLQS